MSVISLDFLVDLAKNVIGQYGYPGIFAISFFSSLLVFVPVPYFIVVIFAAIELDPTIVALLSATGASLAKVVIFRVSYFGGKVVDDNTRRRMRPFEILVSRYGWLASFLAAATPIPDDLIYVPLGFVKYKLWKFAVSLFAGKLLLTLVMTWGSRLSLPYLELLVEQVRDPLSALLVTLGLLTSSAIVILAILKLDWEKLLGPWIKE